MGNEQNEIDVAYALDNDIKVNIFDLVTLIYLIQFHTLTEQKIKLSQSNEEKLDRLTKQANEFMSKRLIEMTVNT